MSRACHILCAKCRALVELAVDATWLATVSCPICGRSDTFSAAVDEANAQFAERLARQAGGRRATAPASSRPRRYRFVYAFSPR